MFEPLTILAALSPADRLMAVKGADAADPLVLDLTIALPVIGAAVVGCVLIHLYRRWQNWHLAMRLFAETADRLRLNPEEQGALARIASAAKLKQINAILNDDVAFEQGVAKLLVSRDILAMPEAQRAHVEGVIDALREKLGLTEGGAGGERDENGKVTLAPGARVSILRRGAEDPVVAAVVSTGTGRITVQPETPVKARPGDAWRIRHITLGEQWEFDTSVIDGASGRVILQQIGEPRCINLRRFFRVPTHNPALIAPFPFVAGAGELGGPTFVPSTVTEIAGRGLRVDSPLETKAGDRVLVIFRPDPAVAAATVQGLGVVRRSLQGGAGMYVTMVEMIGLSDAEVGELVREANSAARRAEIGAPEPAATPVEVP